MEKKEGVLKFVPGLIYFNPGKKPGDAPEGFFWGITKRDRGRPIEWTLRSADPEPPGTDELPLIDDRGNIVPNEIQQPPLPKMGGD